MDPRLEPDQLGAALEQQVLAEPVAAVHLEREPAEVAQLLLAKPQERAALTSELARRRGGTAPWAGGVPAQESLQGRKAHHARRVY